MTEKKINRKKRKSGRSSEELKSMSLLEHIEELRKRLFYIVLGVVVSFLICLNWANSIFAFLSVPVEKALHGKSRLVFTKLQGPFVLYMKVALLAGFLLALPWIFYHLWKFIAPALYKKEKKQVIPFIFFTTISFIGGTAFGYYIMFPMAFEFLVEMGKNFTPMLTIDDYFSLVFRMLLALGCIFELPIIIYFLAKLGIITHRFLIKNYPWAIIIILIIGAVLSPPDVFSQILVSAPLLILYTFGIGIAWFVTKRKELKK
jgi:sec-independent protein translocase protein TatC